MSESIVNTETSVVPAQPVTAQPVPQPANDFAHWALAVPFTADHAKMLNEVHDFVTKFAASLEHMTPMIEQLMPMLAQFGIKL